jgi:DNA-directed RNA polymerase III subunit RPC2
MLVYSSTHERKSKTYVLVKHDKIYLRHNSVTEDVPIVIVFKVSSVRHRYLNE